MVHPLLQVQSAISMHAGPHHQGLEAWHKDVQPQVKLVAAQDQQRVVYVPAGHCRADDVVHGGQCSMALVTADVLIVAGRRNRPLRKGGTCPRHNLCT